MLSAIQRAFSGRGVALFQCLTAHPAVTDDSYVRTHLFWAPPCVSLADWRSCAHSSNCVCTSYTTCRVSYRFTVRSHDRCTPLSAAPQNRPTIASEITAIA